jgi:hypothetical protein
MTRLESLREQFLEFCSWIYGGFNEVRKSRGFAVRFAEAFESSGKDCLNFLRSLGLPVKAGSRKHIAAGFLLSIAGKRARGLRSKDVNRSVEDLAPQSAVKPVNVIPLARVLRAINTLPHDATKEQVEEAVNATIH